MPTQIAKSTCYVTMGFGRKTDYSTGRVLDLDATYRNIIKPAVEEVGLRCIRGDEIDNLIFLARETYEQLLHADVVLVDLSTANMNALYDLGVRHALRAFTTIVIAEEQFLTPFHLDLFPILRYRHLGEGIDYGEALRFRKVLAEVIGNASKGKPHSDSPVYRLFPKLVSPSMTAVSEIEGPVAPPVDVALPPDPYSVLMEQAKEAERRGDFLKAKIVLSSLVDIKPGDTDIIQRLAFATYKSGYPTTQQALEDARGLLVTLLPHTSSDTETLGLWGALHRRRWSITKNPLDLDEAIGAYERGFYLRNDYYNGIGLAFLLNVRSSEASRQADAITDFVLAERVRHKVISICQSAIENEDRPDSRYWVLATMAEAYVGIGDETNAQKTLEEAQQVMPSGWMFESTQRNITTLRHFLKNSPLKSLSERP